MNEEKKTGRKEERTEGNQTESKEVHFFFFKTKKKQFDGIFKMLGQK